MQTTRQTVINNLAAMVQIQVSHGLPEAIRDERGAQIGSKPSKTPQSLVELKPGVNLVDARLWALAKEQKTVQAMLEEVIEPSPAPEHEREKVGFPKLVEGPLVEGKNPLETMKPESAIKLVGETFVASMLQEWLAEEERPAVKKAIEKQLAMVTEPAAPKGRRPQEPKDGKA